MKPRTDKWVVLLVTLLILLGLLAVYSSTSIISPELAGKTGKGGKAAVTQFSHLKKQLFTVFLGLVAMVTAYRLRLDSLRRYAVPVLILSILCLLLVFTPLGFSGGGARRWIKLWPSTFQPSELVKLCMVIFLSWYVSRSWYDKDRVVSFLVPIGVMGVIQVVFLMQPDFGAVMSLGFLTVSLLFLAGARMKYLLFLGLLSVPAIIYLVMEPYRWRRVTAFLDPWKDAQGSGFQLVQSFIALGSGGMKGAGLGQGRQKLSFLPEVHTDFIFALIGEELGFIGASFLIILFACLFFRGVFIAKRANDPFVYYLSFGISLMIALQALINFAVVTGMVPTKGLPLPFISYGGSSLIVSMTAIGLLLNASKNSGGWALPEQEPAGMRSPSSRHGGRREALREAPARTEAHPSGRWQKGYGYRKYGRNRQER